MSTSNNKNDPIVVEDDSPLPSATTSDVVKPKRRARKNLQKQIEPVPTKVEPTNDVVDTSSALQIAATTTTTTDVTVKKKKKRKPKKKKKKDLEEVQEENDESSMITAKSTFTSKGKKRSREEEEDEEDDRITAKRRRIVLDDSDDGMDLLVPQTQAITENILLHTTSGSVNSGVRPVLNQSGRTSFSKQSRKPLDRYFVEDNKLSVINFMTKDTYARNCALCGQLHKAAECPKRLCPLCNRSGHRSSNCQYKLSGVICDWCTKYGHTEENCPLRAYTLSPEELTPENLEKWGVTKLDPSSPYICCRQPQKKPSNIYCFNCGARGHSGLNCPQPTLSTLIQQPDVKREVEQYLAAARDNKSTPKSSQISFHLANQFY